MAFTFNRPMFDRLANHERRGPFLRGLAPWAEIGGWLSKTDATEHLFGSSGRGSPGAAKMLEAWATLGVIEQVKRGRNTYYRPPREIFELVSQRADFNQALHDAEKAYMADGTRPRPKGN